MFPIEPLAFTGFLVNVGAEFTVGMILLRLEERILQMGWKSEGQYWEARKNSSI